MSNTAKKFKSKWTRVAVEGATTDGRQIQRDWIVQMAEQYNPSTYGARVNCEHLKTFMPRGDFGAYGDVLALKAEEVELNGVKKLALFAQIEPTAELIALNKEKQKIYTSIEVNPKFADTGKAYLVGLAVTDNPASLGTEALSFSAQHGMLNGRKQHADNLFTAAEPAELEFTEEQDSTFAELKAKVAELFKRTEKASKDNPELFTGLADALTAALDKHDQEYTAIADSFAEQQAEFATQQAAFAEQQAELDSLKTELADLKQRYAATTTNPPRPTVTGGTGQTLSTF